MLSTLTPRDLLYWMLRLLTTHLVIGDNLQNLDLFTDLCLTLRHELQQSFHFNPAISETVEPDLQIQFHGMHNFFFYFSTYFWKTGSDFSRLGNESICHVLGVVPKLL